MEMSTTLVVASSSISFGRRAVASDEPQPKQAPQPHAYTWCGENGENRLTYRTSWGGGLRFKDSPSGISQAFFVMLQSKMPHFAVIYETTMRSQVYVQP